MIMKNIPRITLTSLVILTLSIGIAYPAFAQTPSTTTKPTVIKFEDICQRIKNRLNVRVGNVDTAKDKNTTIYEGLNKRFEKVAAAAKAKGYDTTEMLAALETSRATVSAYTKANEDYTVELTSTANDVCQSETSYKVMIESTRGKLKAAREAGLTARDVFQYSVLPELRAYKVWLSSGSSDSDSSTDAAGDTTTGGVQ